MTTFPISMLAAAAVNGATVELAHVGQTFRLVVTDGGVIQDDLTRYFGQDREADDAYDWTVGQLRGGHDLDWLRLRSAVAA